jgi:hypothetical protein
MIYEAFKPYLKFFSKYIERIEDRSKNFILITDDSKLNLKSSKKLIKTINDTKNFG